MTPTDEDLLALADRLDEGRSHCGHCGAEAVEQNSRGQYICVACLRENLVRVAHSLRYDAAVALRAIVAERQAIRADRLEAQEALLREAVAALDDARQSLVDSSEEIAELRLTLSKTDLELPWLSDAIDKQTIALAKLRAHLEGEKE